MKIFLIVNFHENYIYSAEDYFCSAEDFLGTRRFSGARRFYLFGYFHEHFLNSAEEKFYSCFFTNIRFYFPKKIFIRAKIFLLVLTFLFVFFWAKLLKIFVNLPFYSRKFTSDPEHS